MSAYGDGVIVDAVENDVGESFFRMVNFIAPYEGLAGYTNMSLNIPGETIVKVGSCTIYPVNFPDNATSTTLKSYVCRIIIDNYAGFPQGLETIKLPIPPPSLTTGIAQVISNLPDFGFNLYLDSHEFYIAKASTIPNLTSCSCFFWIIGL